MVEQNIGLDINPEILEIFNSSNPDLGRLTENPGGVAGDWQLVVSRAWDFVVQHQDLGGGRRSLAIDEQGTLSPTTSGMDASVLMAGRLPFREVSFPYNGTYLHLRITDPGDEEIVFGRLGPPYTIFTENTENNTSLIQHSCHLLFRTDAWIDPPGKRRWFKAPMNPAEVSPLLVSCVGAILDLGEQHFAAPDHDTVRLGDSPLLHLGHA